MHITFYLRRSGASATFRNSPLRVTHYQRRPNATGNFSLERVFENVRRALPADIEAVVSVSRYESRGFWQRLYNILEAPFYSRDVNHITGDVHFLAYLLRKRKTLLTILDCVGLERRSGWRKKVFFWFWYWLPEKRCAVISAISEATKRELLRYLKCPADKIRVIYAPVPAEFSPCPKEFNTVKPVVLQIGTDFNKNIARVAQALRGINCHLRIIGKLSNKDAIALQENGVEHSSAFNISDEALAEEYRRCDMVVFASTYEGFGLPIVETQAIGRPLVTGNLLSMPEVAGDAACLVNPFDVAEIRAGIMRVMEDGDYRRELIRRGYKNVERFRPEVIAAQYAQVYRELAGMP